MKLSNFKYWEIPLIMIGLLLSISSCQKDLNEKLFSQAASETYKYSNIYEAIGIAYVPMRSIWDHHSYYGTNETSSDELVQPANASGWDDGGIYKQMHFHTWTTETPQMDRMWSDFYRGVGQANSVLKILTNNEFNISTGETQDEIISEIKVVRAFYYWLILDNFGDAPLVTEDSNPLDLPEKTSRKEIFDFVVKEITDALPKLNKETSSLTYGRFNYWAAKALLANLYLNAEVYTGTPAWNECISQCNDIIASNNYRLEDNYSDIFKTDNMNSSEIIFAIPFDQNLGTGFYPEMFSWHASLKAKRNMQATPWGSGSAMGVTQFINTYDPEDGRLKDTWLMGPQFALDGVTPLLGSYDILGQQINFTKDLPDGEYTSESEGYRMNKFEVAINAKQDLSNDFPFFRYAEVLLMKAECLLRTNTDIEGAVELVNEVRKRDFKNNPGKAETKSSTLLANSVYKYGFVDNYVIVDPGDQSPVEFGGMLDELGWEFAWEAHRRRDDVRFGVFDTKSWLSHKPVGKDTKTFMIPQSAINANPNLK